MMRKPVLRPSLDSSFMMVLTYAVVVGNERLLSVGFEVDFDFGLRSIGTGGETPALDCVLCRGAEERMAGFDFGFGDSAVWLNGDEENDGSTRASGGQVQDSWERRG